jgi:beta-ureidopropionase / N-carbamoyl-L-amino-acid hydrolase
MLETTPHRTPEIAPDFGRFHTMMAEVARFGATPKGGLHRLAVSAEDKQARDWFTAWIKANGLRPFVDVVGNIIGVLELAGQDAPVVLTGSHLDSQPYGGRFDGAYGVVAACEAVLTVKEAANRGSLAAVRNLGVVSWTNEEGARFQPSLIGSSVYAGTLTAETALAVRDGEGIALGQALAMIGYDGRDRPPRATAYVELHVECGPELDRSGRSLGVFTGWWGAVKARVCVYGEQAHTGPTAMALRKDALYGASLLIAAVRGLSDEANRGGEERLYTSVGRLEVEPNSPNVVPGRATLFIELRSPDAVVLTTAEASLQRLVGQIAGTTGLAVAVEDIARRPAGRFDGSLVQMAERSARQAGHEALHLSTVAAHDAIPLASICPSVVIVAPSVGGVCHREDEFTKAEDLEAGLAALTDMLATLCAGGRDTL